MAIVLESISTQALGSGVSTTITKPTGLAVGDQMFAPIGSVFPVGGAGLLAAPSGWTALFNANYVNGFCTFLMEFSLKQLMLQTWPPVTLHLRIPQEGNTWGVP